MNIYGKLLPKGKEQFIGLIEFCLRMDKEKCSLLKFPKRQLIMSWVDQKRKTENSTPDQLINRQ